MSILRLMLQTSIAGHHDRRGQTLDREDGFQLLAVSMKEMMPLSLEEFTTWLQIHLLKLERNDAIVIRGVHDMATDTSAGSKKLEGKLDALVNLVTLLAVNQKHASVARVCNHSIRGHTLDREDATDSCNRDKLMIYSKLSHQELEAIFSIKCLASTAVVACYRCLLHKPQNAHSLQVAMKKERHLYGGHFKNELVAIFSIKCLASAVVVPCYTCLQQKLQHAHSLQELEAIFSIKYLASTAVMACYRCLQHMRQDAHSHQELEAIFSIKCLASAVVVACYRCLQHMRQDAHSHQVATKKDRHLYGGHWKNGCRRCLQKRQASDSQIAKSPSSQEHRACLPPF
ncbi:hypothetical protein Fmac_024845 [Flemingia macrophylla]|uniref:Uncharacterized protein n=1 Tax=Flemingia macrophylla TaxID=520843 RepID=A0ABD1LQJ3_9FABA